ncbi:MAG: thiol-disulfide isomerase/thioredoxin [Myxococcota bacterium]|jgi:thiol-disulfide isomerase/thioredoxin
MSWQQQLGFVLVAAAVTLAVVFVGTRRTRQAAEASSAVAEPVSVAVAPVKAPEPPQPAIAPAPVPDLPPQARLSEAQWKAKYAASKRELARRTARQEREKAAWAQKLGEVEETIERDDQRLLREATAAVDAAAEAEFGATASLTGKTDKAEKRPKGKLEIVYKFTTWCPHCTRVLPALTQLSRDRNISVRAINTDKDPAAFAAWKRSNSTPFRVERLSRAAAADRIAKFDGADSGSVPYIAILRNGKLVKQHQGAPGDIPRWIRAVRGLL